MNKIPYVLTILYLILNVKIGNTQSCYISYTYDNSGNRIGRVYVGGCALVGDENSLEALNMGEGPSSSKPPIEILEREDENVLKEIDRDIYIYPNPSAHYITIVTGIEPKYDKYILYTESGQIVTQNKISSSREEVDISKLNAGAYFIILYDEYGKPIYKTIIIKQ